MYVYVCASHECASSLGDRGDWIPQSWRYSHCEQPMWLLWTEFKSSGRTVPALNLWAIFSVPLLTYLLLPYGTEDGLSNMGSLWHNFYCLLIRRYCLMLLVPPRRKKEAQWQSYWTLSSCGTYLDTLSCTLHLNRLCLCAGCPALMWNIMVRNEENKKYFPLGRDIPHLLQK